MAPIIAESPSASLSPPAPNKKRKREEKPADELEINVELPEPPSKKALRRAKKGKPTSGPKASLKDVSDLQEDDVKAETTHSDRATPLKSSEDPQPRSNKRSDHGIWIGNLPFHITPALLSTFLCTHGSLQPEAITRINLPLSNKPLPPHFARRQNGEGAGGKEQMQNKGFAYVDFDSADALFQALQVTETLMDGRKVLIKDAKSFAGRPQPKPEVETAAKRDARLEKPRSKRIFVGNLGFDVTRDDLLTHFAQAGEVEDVFLATFEDTGKCKGFGWVTFADEESSENAVRGRIWKHDAVEEGASDEDGEEDEVVDGAEDKGVDVKSEDGDSSSSDSDSVSDGDIKMEDDKEKVRSAANGTKKAVNGTAKPVKPAKRPQEKKRKWWINQLYGRQLRREYAEDASTRYKKRFRKGGPRDGDAENDGRKHQRVDSATQQDENVDEFGRDTSFKGKEGRIRGDPDQRLEARRKKHQDARNIAPGKALANAPRASGAIVQGQGKKMTFEE